MKKRPQCSFFRLTVHTHIHRTESEVNLVAAIRNILQLSAIKKEKQNILVGTSDQVDSLSIVYEQVKSKRSFSVLRRMLINNLEGNTTSFLLNKQAAAAGVVALIDRENESPLGGLKVQLQCQPIEHLIDWITDSSHLE